ncbi:MAG: hypothetical protein ACJ8LG_23040 [Massilia sp.]
MIKFNTRHILVTLLFFCVAQTAQAATNPAKKEHGSPADGQVVTSGEITENQVAIVGSINYPLVAYIARGAKKYPHIQRLVIDSDGGVSEAAVQLAQVVREHGWDIVVKNKCFSACANFIFPAGKRKTVLPNSWVGIHDTGRLFRRADGSLHFITGNEIPGFMASGNVTSESADLMRKKESAANAFYASLGLSAAPLQDYANYISARKHVLGEEDVDHFPGVPGCPRYMAWALNKKQLEEMGVTGIVDFWFPANAEEERAFYKDKLFPSGSIYIGDAKKLRTFCKRPALSWFDRIWLKRESSQ